MRTRVECVGNLLRLRGRRLTPKGILRTFISGISVYTDYGPLFATVLNKHIHRDPDLCNPAVPV